MHGSIHGPILTAALACALTTSVHAGRSTNAVLQRAGAAVVHYATELPRLVATETYVQHSTPAARGTAGERRQWVAEFAWVALPGELEAIGFRDVVEVDGTPVANGRVRLTDLLHGPSETPWAQAHAILEEGARHNLLPGSRNFNQPTVAFFFLHPERQQRFRWTRRSDARDAIWEIEYRERERPTVIRAEDGRSVYSRGHVWIDVASGGIRQTDLRIQLHHTQYQLTTWFEHAPALNLVVPVRMEERYTSAGSTIIGAATYTNYRRFETRARLLPQR